MKKACHSKGEVHLPPAVCRQLDEFIEQLPTTEGHLVTVLHKAQSLFGYLPREVQEFVACRMGVPVSKVYGVVSFYTFFTMVPRGRVPISICMGTACFVKGAENVVDAFSRSLGVKVGEVTPDGKFSLDILRCVGACALAPTLTVGEKVFARVTPDEVRSIIADF
jgi:NADP-reducing hydrogenase subunit HndA